jgi:F0F1-type ATP synthase membrane subunit b/b'
LRSTKGFVITGIILGAITAASFAVWLVPQNAQTRFVVTDAEQQLDAIIEQQKTIAETIAEELDKMYRGEITPDNYISIAEISSSQINSFIITTIESDVPSEWHDSYLAIAESMRSYNSYIRETIVVAEKLKSDANADITQEKAKLDELLRQSEEYLADANDARPS